MKIIWKEEKDRYVQSTTLNKIREDLRPQYFMITSDRNDGKSYAVKETALRDFWEKGLEFAYLRRYEIDIKREDQSLYWSDFSDGEKNLVKEITGGKWSEVIAPRGGKTFNLANPVEGQPGKYDIGPLCGRIHALSIAKSYKSMQYPAIGNIIFEEFVTDSGYLFNEPSRLFQYVSTIFRGRMGTVWLVGNNVSRLNPYFREWQLVNALKMKPGDLDTYKETYTDEDGNLSETTVAMYWPDVEGKAGKKSMFFGNAAGMIQGKRFDSREMTHLERPRNEYEVRYSVVMESGAGLNFLMTLLQHRTERARVLWYVEPKTTEIQKGTRIIGAIPHEGRRWTKDFIPLTPREAKAFQYFKLGRVAYSDNLTGTEFQRALAQIRVTGSGTEG